MSGDNNPYAASFGSSMTASATFSPQSAAPAAAAGDVVSDTTTATFARDVLQASLETLVLVDFWAPWCGPCKQLTPVIEKVAREAKGRVKLVKMNIDDHPQVAGQLGIQSIPAVIAFKGGRPVDGFMGAVPETQIRQFIEKNAGPATDDRALEIEAALTEAAALAEAGDLENAAGLYAAVLDAEPTHVGAFAGLVDCMLKAGDIESAKEQLAVAPEEMQKDPAIAALTKKIGQIEEARKLGDPVALEQQIATNPDDHAARVKLAKIRNVEGDRTAAADHLLWIMKRDRTFEDDGARRELLQFFEVWGPKDPATIAARRKLSSILFS